MTVAELVEVTEMAAILSGLSASAVDVGVTVLLSDGQLLKFRNSITNNINTKTGAIVLNKNFFPSESIKSVHVHCTHTYYLYGMMQRPKSTYELTKEKIIHASNQAHVRVKLEAFLSDIEALEMSIFEYYRYIVESYKNGQIKQSYELFCAMPTDNQIEYVYWFNQEKATIEIIHRMKQDRDFYYR